MRAPRMLAYVFLSTTLSACLYQNHPLFQRAEEKPKETGNGQTSPTPAEQTAQQPSNPMAGIFGMPPNAQPPGNTGGGSPAVTNTSHAELCYAHECNGRKTGRKCFADKASYCQSLCAEDNCASRMSCQSECN